MQPLIVREMIEKVDVLLAERLDAKGKDVEAKFASVRKRMPAKVRKEMQFLVETSKRVEHPKLALKTDPAKVSASYGVVRDHLEKIQPKKIKKRKQSSLIANIAWQVLIVLVLLLIVLRWRGFI